MDGYMKRPICFKELRCSAQYRFLVTLSCKFKSQVWVILLQSQVRHSGFIHHQSLQKAVVLIQEVWEEIDLKRIEERIVIDIHSWGIDLYVASSWYVYVHICRMSPKDRHHPGGRNVWNVYIGAVYWRTGSILSELKMSIWCSPNKPVKKLQVISL
jgi:hypothetical protein